MSQIITTYLLNDLEEPISMEREEFFASQVKAFKTSGKPNRANEVVDLILFTPDKKIILQKRSLTKTENPGLLDTAIGAYILHGRSPSFMVMTATLRELKVPTFIFGTNEDMRETLKLLKDYWNTSAIAQFVDRRTANFKKLISTETITLANTYNLFVGVYGGPITPNVNEAEIMGLFTIEELERELIENSEKFTPDFVFFYNEYRVKINQFLKCLDQTKTS